MTRVVIGRKVRGVGAVPVVGVHARFRIASVKLVEDALQIHLETRFGDAEDLTAHFAPPTCEPAAVREQLASVLQFESDADARQESTSSRSSPVVSISRPAVNSNVVPHLPLNPNLNPIDGLTGVITHIEGGDRSSLIGLLGELWSGFDNIGFCSGDLFWAIHERVLDMESVIPEMMSHEERVAFEALPEQITIYRGCGPKNMFGFSWSLDRRTAAKFPFMQRYTTDEPKLLTATISKNRAAALKLERGEQEVIVFDYLDEPSIYWTEEPLLTPC